HPFHSLEVLEGGRIQEDEVIEPYGTLPQPLTTVRMDELMLTPIETIQREVASCPVEVGVRQIHRGALRRAARGGIHGRRPGVGEEIQEALAGCRRAQTLPRQPMVQKQPRIQVVVEVDAQAKPALLDQVIALLVIDFVVLLPSLCPSPEADADALRGYSRHI